jgi:tetratricopeptide (TPR) repeat protein
VAVVLTYGNSLSGPFVLDDQAAVAGNTSIRDLSQIQRVVSPPADSPVAGRPIVNLSFALNYAAGGLDVRGYHAVNIAAHVLCVLLAYGLVRRTLELPRVRARFDGYAGTVAFACALLWGVHPLNSEVVDYLSQRTESMMAACYLLTMYATVRSAGEQHRGLWTGVGVAAGLAGVLCKESMATAPLAVALYDRVFLASSWREAFRERRVLYSGLALSWVVVGVVLAAGPRARVAGFSSGIAPWTYLLNQAEMIAEYLRLVVWPDRLVAFYGWPQPLTLGDVLPQAMFVLVLLAAAVVALVRIPVAGFAGAWFFLTLAPASSIVPVATEVGAERRMYLPLLGVIVLAVFGARALWRRLRSADRERPRVTAAAGAIATIALATALAAATVVRNGEYASALTLTQTIVERRPNAVAHHMYAEQLALAGQQDEAVAHLREAVSGGNSRAGYLLGITLFNQGHIEEATERLEAFVRTEGVRQVPSWLEPPTDEILRARTVMGFAFLQKREWDRAAAQAEATLAVVPRYPDARAVLAHARFGQERWAEAVREYRLYVGARPTDIQALLNFGVALVAAGQLDEALPVFRRAVEADPSNPQARRLLALAEEDSRK